MKMSDENKNLNSDAYIVKMLRYENDFKQSGAYFLGRGNVAPHKNSLTNVDEKDATLYKTKAAATAAFKSFCGGKNETCEIIHLTPFSLIQWNDEIKKDNNDDGDGFCEACRTTPSVATYCDYCAGRI